MDETFKLGDFVWFSRDMIFVCGKKFGLKIATFDLKITKNEPPKIEQPLRWRKQDELEWQAIRDDMEYSFGWKPLDSKKSLKDMPPHTQRSCIMSMWEVKRVK